MKNLINLINDWDSKIQKLLQEKNEALEFSYAVRHGRDNYKTQMDHGLATWEAAARIEQTAKIAGYESLLVRKEIAKFMKENREKLSQEDFIKICKIFNQASHYHPQYEVQLFDSKGRYIETVISEDFKEHKKNIEEFEPFYKEWDDIEREKIDRKRREEEEAKKKAAEVVEEPKETPKEEIKESKEKEEEPKEEKEEIRFEMGVIESFVIGVEKTKSKKEIEEVEEKEEEPKEKREVAPKAEKTKKISKTAKEKIKREKRKIKKLQEREKEIRKIEREEKKLLKEQEKIAKKLEKLAKAKLALLAKLNKTSGGSEGGEGAEGGETEGNKGGEKDKGTAAKKVSRASRIKETKETIREEDKEEWKKAKNKIAVRRRALTEQGFKTVLKAIANTKGEPKKVKSASKKAKKFLEKIEGFENLINETSKFASWAPAWFTGKSKVVSKLKKLVMEWLEKNEEKEEEETKTEVTKPKKSNDSEGSEGGEGFEGGETEGKEEKEEEPKEEKKETAEVVEEAPEIEEIEATPEVIEETEEEEEKEEKKPTLKDWRKLKEEVGTKKRYIHNSSEIGWIAARVDYKPKNLKGDLLTNYKKLKKGLELIEKFENLINTSKRFEDKPWAAKWLKKQAPLVWKIKKFALVWLEENKKGLISAFSNTDKIPEEYRKEVEEYKKELELWKERSRKYWIKRIEEVKAKRAKEMEEEE